MCVGERERMGKIQRVKEGRREGGKEGRREGRKVILMYREEWG